MPIAVVFHIGFLMGTYDVLLFLSYDSLPFGDLDAHGISIAHVNPPSALFKAPCQSYLSI